MALELRLDYDRGIPIYRQIYEAVVAALASGALDRGEQLPTIHELAGISRQPEPSARVPRAEATANHASAGSVTSGLSGAHCGALRGSLQHLRGISSAHGQRRPDTSSA